MDEYRNEEARTLKSLREAVPISQVVAAVAINVRPATLSSWENGKSVPRLPLEDWCKLAELYGVSIDELRDAVAKSQQKSGR
ncbi:helix-turn-helix domain-containing protein [Adonisia turfae]|uniref:XRE family transcriptional regulator n=1 Tax=Adonisia turfae CCMR0081 TaxID=2292702 RepID=A0A6M0RHE8_9CYAN|nr:XRE family transcriptional regulator [Adonisia turfae CCMR0081]